MQPAGVLVPKPCGFVPAALLHICHAALDCLLLHWHLDVICSGCERCDAWCRMIPA